MHLSIASHHMHSVPQSSVVVAELQHLLYSDCAVRMATVANGKSTI